MKELKLEMPDILIIGSGLAGITAALSMPEDKCITIVSKGSLCSSNSWRAQGGMAAALARTDHWRFHEEDTLRAGAFHNRKGMVRDLVSEATEAVSWLEQQGVAFCKNESNQYQLGCEGAHSQPRIVHCNGDQTGRNIMERLKTRVSKCANIKVQDHTSVIKLHVSTGECEGADALTAKGEYIRFYAKSVVLATGGAGALFETTTNHAHATGDGLALAYQAGARLVDVEFIQFHPTLGVASNKEVFLISEALRGAGAKLETARKKQVTSHLEHGDLSSRDQVARAIYQLREQGESVYVNAASIPNKEAMFPAISAWCRAHHISMEKIPVQPGAHYMMGGVYVNEYGETDISRLFAIGETAYTGVHGANRLASNSLLEAIVTGRKISESVHKYLQKPLAPAVHVPETAVNTVDREGMARIRNKMEYSAGVKRLPAQVNKALQELEKETADWKPLSGEYIENSHALTACQLILKAILARPESLGAHYVEGSQKEDKGDYWLIHSKYCDQPYKVNDMPLVERKVVNNERSATQKRPASFSM
ncbi:L-aspartate oxidase [Salsuginibacillus kocurii]|uniref:L-aspartate oxidase n=1 Tax=Salsuginibacillus kocurii TaxID=427078 RepID=UPI00035FD2EB|nr:FAD-binding protein [Salsuginibacillus kocurii]